VLSVEFDINVQECEWLSTTGYVFVKTFDASFEILHTFIWRYASSPTNFILSLEMCDALFKTSFLPIIPNSPTKIKDPFKRRPMFKCLFSFNSVHTHTPRVYRWACILVFIVYNN